MPSKTSSARNRLHLLSQRGPTDPLKQYRLFPQPDGKAPPLKYDLSQQTWRNGVSGQLEVSLLLHSVHGPGPTAATCFRDILYDSATNFREVNKLFSFF